MFYPPPYFTFDGLRLVFCVEISFVLRHGNSGHVVRFSRAGDGEAVKRAEGQSDFILTVREEKQKIKIKIRNFYSNVATSRTESECV